MSRRPNSWLVISGLVVILAGWGCGDDDGPEETTDVGGSEEMPDDGGEEEVSDDAGGDDVGEEDSAVDSGESDIGEEDASEGDAIVEDSAEGDVSSEDGSEGDVVADTAGDLGTTDGDVVEEPDAEVCSEDCPEITVDSTGGFAIVAIDFTHDLVRIRNNTDSNQDLQNWEFCSDRRFYGSFVESVEVAAGGELVVDLGTDLAGSINVTANGELALFNFHSARTASLAEAFVQWGSGSGGGSRVAVAVEAGVWADADAMVEVCRSHEGFVLTGDPTVAADYTSVSGTCLEAE